MSNKAYKGGTKNIAEFITQVKSKIIKQARHRWEHIDSLKTEYETRLNKELVENLGNPQDVFSRDVKDNYKRAYAEVVNSKCNMKKNDKETK